MAYQGQKRGNMIYWKEYSFTTKGLRCDSSSTTVPADTLTGTFHLPFTSLWLPFRGIAPTLPTHVDCKGLLHSQVHSCAPDSMTTKQSTVFLWPQRSGIAMQ